MFIIDRIDEDFVIIEATDENGEITVLKIERQYVSDNAFEGDVLIFVNGMYIPDKEATKQRKNSIYNKLKNSMK